ncbi:uncharacterized protein [Henckelia pumila]|uniref:uncharacterized protein n=1 Tax=Henckelia pumila TaxID=405737 RepID=UPI003C6E505B
MNRNAFARLCYLLTNVGGLVESRYVKVEEKVAMLLSILAHHKKNRVTGHDYMHSGHTVSNHFHEVLASILKLHPILLVKPIPITEDSSNDTWKWFKEGSAADARVLRDAVTRSEGLKVPRGCYYLCDNGYANVEGFLTPYRRVRYHIHAWANSSIGPQNYKECFNAKHCRARNVIERAFGLLKKRWVVLRSPTFYPLKIQNRMIMACILLHNFIRTQMPNDPVEEVEDTTCSPTHGPSDDFIDNLTSSQAWDTWRDNLANSMYQREA